MTVETTTNTAIAEGNGVTTVWPFNFRIDEQSSMLVTIRESATGNLIATLSPGDYTLAGLGNDAGGTVTYPPGAGTILPAGQQFIIQRIVPLTQELELTNVGGFQAAAVEKQLDDIVMQIQQVANEVARTITVVPGQTPPTAEQIANAEAYGEAAQASAASASADAITASSAATSASASESASSISETNASNSAISAAASAAAALISENNSDTSETNAATSATTASGAATTATTQAGIATTQAGIATTQAGIATAAAASIPGSVIIRAATTAIMKALVVSATIGCCHLEDGNKGGIFTWIPGNFTAQAAADPLGGIFVPSNVVGQGITVGCWIRDQPPGASLNPQWFGAPLDGVNDDQPALQAALNFATFLGGCTVEIPTGRWCFIKLPLTIKKRCTLKGSNWNTGSPGDNSSTLYGNYQYLKIDNSPGTGIINMESGSALIGLVIFKNGMVWPATANSMTANSLLWTGTAVQIQGEDTLIEHCTILGFNTALFSTGNQRIRVSDCNVDCINGFNIQNCLDITYLARIHCWPFATIAASAAGTTGASILRTGNAFDFEAGGDWNKLDSCFSYGYKVGFRVNNCNSMTLLSCSSDNALAQAGTAGFQIEGTSLDTRLIGCQTAASEQGVHLGTTGATLISDLVAWSNTTHGILIDGSGSVSIEDSYLRAVPSGITINNLTAKIAIDNCRFADNAGAPITYSVANRTTTISSPKTAVAMDSLCAVNGNQRIQALTAADGMVIPMDGEVFILNGAATIGTFKGVYPGRRVTLICITGISIINATGSFNISTQTGGTQATGANVAIVLNSDGDRWWWSK